MPYPPPPQVSAFHHDSRALHPIPLRSKPALQGMDALHEFRREGSMDNKFRNLVAFLSSKIDQFAALEFT